MKGKSPEVTSQYTYPGAQDALQGISGLAASAVGKLGEPYSGQRVAGMDPMQEQAYSAFEKWMNQGGTGQYTTDPLYTQAKTLLGNVLRGDYLKADSPYMQWQKQNLLQTDLPTAQALLNREIAKRGTWSSSGAYTADEDLQADALDTLGGIYANQWNTEFNRQMGAIQPAMQISQQESQLPLSDIELGIQMGEFPRQIQQQEYDTAFEDWLRQRQETVYTPLQMAGQLGNQKTYSMSQGSQSPFSSWISPLLTLGAGALAPVTGGASLMAIPALQGLQQVFSQPGVPQSQFAGAVNAVSPYFGSFANTLNRWANPYNSVMTGGQGGQLTGIQPEAGGLQTWSPFLG